MSNVFIAQPDSLRELPVVSALLQEATVRLFPRARPLDVGDECLKSPHSLFFRDGNYLLWIELALVPFSREEIPNYLGKASRIQSLFPLEMIAILAAPHFESGVKELLELTRLSIRLFRYQVGTSGLETALWVEEMTRCIPQPPPRSPEGSSGSWPASCPEVSWSRLSREELSEFIQLELDACQDR